MKIKQLLVNYSETLKKISHSPRLDAELLIAHAIKQTRIFLYTHRDYELTNNQYDYLCQLLQQRLKGKPMAYILGKQAFWNLELEIEEGTLIPRPETECLVEKTLELLPKNEIKAVLDLGTGSGAIILALASERPHWIFYAGEISEKSLAMAKKNAQKYNLTNIHFFQSNWFDGLPQISFDCIVSNPPYIAENDPELEPFVEKYEPREALIAPENALSCFKLIVENAGNYLKQGGYLVLEHGYQQSAEVQAIMRERQFQSIHSYKDYSGQLRFTVCQKT